MLLARLRDCFDRLFVADRSLVAVLLLALLIVPMRSAMIASVHSECIDDDYHLVRGVRFLRGELGKTPLNDPVLGETVISLPVWLAGAVPNNDVKYGLILHGQRVSVETLQMLVALWKSVLFVPFVGFAFCWARQLYNARAGWAAAMLLLIEPTISAHVAPAALDVLGFEMIAISCWCWWRYFERPTWTRLTIASVVAAIAMMTKHTAIVVPLVAATYAVLWWFREVGTTTVTHDDTPGMPSDTVLSYAPRTPWRPSTKLRRFALHAIAAIGIAFATLTLLSGRFQPISTPRATSVGTSFLAWLAQYPLPGGYYWRSLQNAFAHGEAGHPAWLLGQPIVRGSWRNWAYYVVVAAYKVPIGIAGVIALGVASLVWIRPKFGELALVVPMVLLFALITIGGINIGFRHAIPAYGLLLMLSTRILLTERRAIVAVVGMLLAGTVVDVARFGPDLISYINVPRKRVWLDVSDSNLDWGQGVKEVRTWIDTHPKVIAGKSVAVRLFGLPYSENVEYYLGNRATAIRRSGEIPTGGLLIVSPTFVVGSFEDDPERFAFLRDRDPIAIIGHSNLVFDLDASPSQGAKRNGS